MRENHMTLKSWMLAARPKTLPAAIAPVVIGAALAFADGKGNLPSALLAALCALLIQIGTNYANDYFDFVKGTDAPGRLGPTRATAAGWVTPQAMKCAFLFVFGLAALAGIPLLIRGGWPTLIIGALCIAAGILYTGGPFPLGYNGLGDLFVFIFFGLVAVGGSYYVQALEITSVVLLAGVAPGLLSTAILIVNNLRDVENDRIAGKRTVPVLFGVAFGRGEYLFCLLFACIGTPLTLVLLKFTPLPVMMASFSLLFSIPPLKTLFREPPGAVYNHVLAQTGRLLLVYSVLFSIGALL
jgi:1,4-dihydroxy-2-naphthoate polyprenyltransferase